MLPQYDIAIAGAGPAGMVCAIRAAARGLRVLVLDKDTEPGGTLHVTAGHLSAAGTMRQQEKGIADTPQQHYNDIARISRHTMNPAITRKAVLLAPATLNWLQRLGYPFHNKTPLIIHGHEPYSVPRTYFGANDISPQMNQPGKTIYRLLLPLWQQYVANGHISFLPGRRLTAVQTSNGSISAFVAQHEKKDVQFTARHYVLTTGGYAASPAFFEQSGNRLISTARPASTGDGITVAVKAGGIFAGHEKHSSTLGGIEMEPGSGRADFWGAWARVSNGADRRQREIYVNERGQRFMNEYDLNADERERLVLQQPGRRFWVVFDAAALTDGPCLVPQWTYEQLRQEALKEKAVWQAGSIETLAVKTGLPPAALAATVRQFNGFAAAGHDAAFGRTFLQHPVATPPFYAVLVYAYSLISFGGLQVNESLQVLHKEGGAFENLYAAGEILGAAATSGHAFCGGMLLTPALAFGQWLGDTLEASASGASE